MAFCAVVMVPQGLFQNIRTWFRIWFLKQFGSCSGSGAGF
jgi:hypothetical protein